MLPLAATAFPDSPQALRTAILGGFREYGIEAREVVVEGADFPKIGLLRIDLTGAKATRELRIPHPGPLQGGKIEAERVEIDARPLFLETMPVRIEIRAEKAAFPLSAQAEGGAGSLVALQQAGEGRLEMEIRKADLEELLQSVAMAAAAERGVEIKETHLELTSRGKRALTFRAEVIAKMFLMKAPVSLTGDLDLDDDLNLRISQLTLEGVP